MSWWCCCCVGLAWFKSETGKCLGGGGVVSVWRGLRERPVSVFVVVLLCRSGVA